MVVDDLNLLRDERVRYRRANGLCIKCGKSQDPQYLTCDECRKKRREYHKEHPANPGTRRKYYHKRRRELINEGLCLDCGKVKERQDRRLCNQCLKKRADIQANFRIRKTLRSLGL
jgi:NMD protein affecting ribosome stability and mRNA decay